MLCSGQGGHLHSITAVKQMEAAAAKYRAAPDVHFHESHKLLIRVLTNIVSEPEGMTAEGALAGFWRKVSHASCADVKYRRLAMQGKAFTTLVAAAGCLEFLLALGFRKEGEFLALPLGVSIDPAALDCVLTMEEVRRAEKERKAVAEAAQKKAEKERQKKQLEERLAADRKEAAQRTVVASRSTLVPFSNRDKVGLKDVGAGDAAPKGG